MLLAIPGAAALAQDPPKPAAPTREPPRLIGPRSGPERKKAASRYGATDATEKAVAAGLDWLARHQDESGGWDADGFDARCAEGSAKCAGKGKGQHGEDMPCPFDTAISALAVLAFLGDGHIPDAPDDKYAAVVKKGLGRIGTGGDVWSTPIALECLAEAEVMEGRGRFSADIESAASQLLRARQSDGAWGYCGSFRPGSDVPYTALVTSALVAARDAGVKLPADAGAKTDAFLDSLEEKKGKLAYVRDGRQYGYTPTTSNAHCALAIRELWETGTGGARHRAHAALVASELPVWKISFREVDVPGRGKVKVEIGNLSLYQWWYGTVGAFQRGAESWSAWFGATKTALTGHQRKDGCARGSWDPEGTYERQTGGRVFATALAVLMLEQPYRHRRLRGDVGK